MKKVIIIGGIPSPIGGVTSYIYRLITTFPVFFSNIYDLYPHKDKFHSSFVPLHVFKGYWDYKFLQSIISKKDITFHFNFSTTKSLLLFLFLYKRQSTVWILTLHNGDLNSDFIPQCVINFLLNKFDKVVALSKLQQQYYKSSANIKFQIVNMDPFVPCDYDTDLQIPVEYNKFKNVNVNKSIILMNGYCKPFYKFEDGIEFVMKNINYCLVIVLYGDRDPMYRALLENRAACSNNILFLEGVEQSVFFKLLKDIDIYLRANTVDSFGIAVADAVCLGKKVLASDICERFHGAQVFKTFDKKDMFRKLESLSINVEPVSKSRHKKILEQQFLKYMSLYK